MCAGEPTENTEVQPHSSLVLGASEPTQSRWGTIPDSMHNEQVHDSLIACMMRLMKLADSLIHEQAHEAGTQSNA